MAKVNKFLILILIITLNASCQMKNKYEWQSYTCQSLQQYKGNENIYSVEFVRGDILTSRSSNSSKNQKYY